MRTTIVLALSACTMTAQTDPTSRGLRADQHLDEADDHATRAEQMTRWPDFRTNDIGRTWDNDTGRFDDPNLGLWYPPLDTVEKQRRQAAIHRSEVGEIYGAFDAACANIAPDRVRASPLRRHGIGGTPTAEGVVVLLEPEAGAPASVLAELRCHRAWMMLSDTMLDDESPLDLPGLEMETRGDPTGVSVEMRVDDRRLVPELQRRTALELEASTRRRAS